MADDPTGGTTAPNPELDQLRADNAKLRQELQQIRDGNGSWVPRERLAEEAEKLRQALAETSKLQGSNEALARQLIGAEEQLKKADATPHQARVQELEAELSKVRAEYAAQDVLREAGLKNGVVRGIVLGAYQKSGEGKDFAEWYAAWREAADADTKELLAAATAAKPAAGDGGEPPPAGGEEPPPATPPRRTPAPGSSRQATAPKGALSAEDVAKMTREQFAEAQKNSPTGLVGL